ncbi:MAG: DUF1828 domain-containing protein [Promethearchaeota archaeon]
MQIIDDLNIKKLFCKEIKEVVIKPGLKMVYFPFYPYLDDALYIVINNNKDEGKIIIDDDGQVFNSLFINMGLMKDDLNAEQKACIEYIEEKYGLSENDGKFTIETDNNKYFKDITLFIQAIIQLISIDALIP